MFNIEWTEPAWKDLDEVTDYLSGHEDSQLADEIVNRILKAPEYLSSLPWSGKPGRVPETRELLVQNTRYALVYSVSDATVFILRVMHSSRLFPVTSSSADDDQA